LSVRMPFRLNFFLIFSACFVKDLVAWFTHGMRATASAVDAAPL